MPKPIEHGTNAGYARGCHCVECRAGHAAYHRAWIAKQKAAGRPIAKSRKGQTAYYVEWRAKRIRLWQVAKQLLGEYDAGMLNAEGVIDGIRGQLDA